MSVTVGQDTSDLAANKRDKNNLYPKRREQIKWLTESESEVAQSCLTLCDPMNYSLPGSSIHGIFQARALEWGAISFSSLTEGLKKQRFPGVSPPKSRFCRLGGRASVYIFLTWIPDHISVLSLDYIPQENTDSF